MGPKVAHGIQAPAGDKNKTEEVGRMEESKQSNKNV